VGLDREGSATGVGLDVSHTDDVLDALPGAVVVIDGVGTIKYASRPAAELLGVSLERLVGSSVLQFVSEDTAWAYAAAVAMSTDYADVTTGPLRVSIKPTTPEGATWQADLWATNRLDDPAVNGIICLLTPETVSVWLAEAIEAASANAPFTTIAGHVCTAMRGHPVVADAALLGPCDGGLVPVVPSALNWRLLQSDGPWRESLATGIRCHADIDQLAPDIQDAMNDAGYHSLWVEPVFARDGEGTVGVLLLWKRRAGGPSPNQLSSLHQAASILRLCWPDDDSAG